MYIIVARGLHKRIKEQKQRLFIFYIQLESQILDGSHASTIVFPRRIFIQNLSKMPSTETTDVES